MSSTLSGVALDQLFLEARTYNSWQDVEVTETQMRQIYDLTKMGPTSVNCSPARFVFLRRGGNGHKKLMPFMAQGNKEKTQMAPWVVIVAQDMNFHHKFETLFPHNPGVADWFADEAHRRDTMVRNATLQGGYLIAATRAVGLDCGPMSGFDMDGVKQAFFGPETGEMASWEPNFIMNIGHGVEKDLHPRSPRLLFEDACRLV